MSLKGFGTWPHFFQHEPKRKNRGQVPNPFVTSSALSRTKGTKMISKGFGTWVRFSSTDQHGTARVRFQTHLEPGLFFSKMKGTKLIPKGFWNLTLFQTRTKVEQQGSGFAGMGGRVDATPGRDGHHPPNTPGTEAARGQFFAGEANRLQHAARTTIAQLRSMLEKKARLVEDYQRKMKELREKTWNDGSRKTTKFAKNVY